MKKFFKTKKVISVTCLVVLIISCLSMGIYAIEKTEVIQALKNYGITIKLDGQIKNLYDVNGTQIYPISYNGSTYVPIRAVSNLLGVNVDWDSENNSVLLESKKVEESMDILSESYFEDYNDKIVTGTQVKSAVQNLSGKLVAILICTKSGQSGFVTYMKHSSGVTCYKLNDKVYMNYNALLGIDSSGMAATLIHNNTSLGSLTSGVFVPHSSITNFDNDGIAATLKDGYLTISQAFQIDPIMGKVVYDNVIEGQSRYGTCEYIYPTSKFKSNIVKDSAGYNIGIMFTEID